jgi:hypothetical protein
MRKEKRIMATRTKPVPDGYHSATPKEIIKRAKGL